MHGKASFGRGVAASKTHMFWAYLGLHTVESGKVTILDRIQLQFTLKVEANQGLVLVLLTYRLEKMKDLQFLWGALQFTALPSPVHHL